MAFIVEPDDVVKTIATLLRRSRRRGDMVRRVEHSIFSNAENWQKEAGLTLRLDQRGLFDTYVGLPVASLCLAITFASGNLKISYMLRGGRHDTATLPFAVIALCDPDMLDKLAMALRPFITMKVGP